MGFEVKYIYHPRKEEGGYNTDLKESKVVKVGKPFDNTDIESVAAAIMGQLARRDVWVVDVEICEYTKSDVSFKECKDGKGIMLKNRKFSFNEAANLVSEDVVEEIAPVPLGTNVHPHELLRKKNQIEDLYSNPNRSVVVKSNNMDVPINKNKVIYKVIFDPAIQLVNQAKRLPGKFTIEREYPVHHILQHPTGNLEMQRIATTDDTGKVVIVEDKFFVNAGVGLFGDKELDFSGNSRKPMNQSKLLYEDELRVESSNLQRNSNIPIDNGMIPDNYLQVPDLRANRR